MHCSTSDATPAGPAWQTCVSCCAMCQTQALKLREGLHKYCYVRIVLKTWIFRFGVAEAEGS